MTVADKLNIPSARYGLCSFKGENACYSENVLSAYHHDSTKPTLLSGNRILVDESGKRGVGGNLTKPDPENPEQSITLRRAGHSLQNIHRLLESVDPPRGSEQVHNLTAFDCFVSYLCLDALIANQDRHEENWALVRVGDHAYLSPSYDHGAAFLTNHTVEDRQELLRDVEGLERYLSKGRAKAFEHYKGRPVPTLVDFALTASGMASNKATTSIWQRLARIDCNELEHQLISDLRQFSASNKVPETDIQLACKVMQINQRRIQNAIDKYCS